MYPSFKIFGVITLRPYSLFMLLGAGVCILLFLFLTFKRHKGKTDENIFAFIMLIIAMAAAIPAAIVFDSLFHWAERGAFIISGSTFYGGLLFAIALFPLLLLIKKNRAVSIYERLADLAPGIPAGHFFGRIGCFFDGCCFGAPTNGPFGVVFPEGSFPYEFYGGPVAIHPTQLYEAAALAVIFLILFFWGKKNAFPLYLMLYGVARFILECFRSDSRGSLFGLPLSPAQIISIVLILLGEAIWLIRIVRRLKKAKTG